jgi:hypothetical protein
VTRPARPLAVLALSAGTLACEILLVRVFAIEQFHHFAYLAVGVAMLGIGAGGTVFALARARGALDPDRWLAAAALATAAALLVVPAAADLPRVDATRLAWDWDQWVRLATLQALLALPFALGGLATLAALAGAADRPGLLYGASFAGSGVGAALGIGALAVVDLERALALPALLAAPAVWAVATHAARPRWWRGAAVLLLMGAGAGAVRPPWRLELVPYKGLSQVRAFPGSRVAGEWTSPTGWVVAVDAEAFRFAPGLSLTYAQEFPRQRALFVDGELAGATTEWTPASRAMLDWQPAALPFALGQKTRVLILGSAGGHQVAMALAHGATDVTAVELQPAIPALAAGPARSAGAAPGARVRWVVGEARAVVARTRERYDLITLGPLAGGAPGATPVSVGEDFHHTVEAYRAALERLAPGGVLALTGWLSVPPRGEVRTILTAAAALRRHRPAHAADGMIVVRSWGTVTTLVKPDGFTTADAGAIAAWSATRNFDVDWRPGLTAPETRYNFLERPVLFEAAQAATKHAKAAEAFAASYPFDVHPATDARPYPHAFIGWRTLALLTERGRGDWLPFAEWGYLAVLATLAQGLALAAVLLLLPLLLSRGGHRLPRGGGRVLAYFGALGLGYLFAEIAAIQQLTLLLGHPVYAVAFVLVALLVGSGAGSAWSDRFSPAASRVAAWTLVPGLVLLAALLLPGVHAAQAWPLATRLVVALAVLVPFALVMGMPFPLGLRALTDARHKAAARPSAAGRGGPASSETTAGRAAASCRAPDGMEDGGGPEGVDSRIAWAWATNGFSSVIAAPLGALIALEYGSRTLFLAAALAYGVAGMAGGRESGRA